MSDSLNILKNEISRDIYNLCLKEGLTKKEISIRRYGKWMPNAVIPKIKELEKAGYLILDRKGISLRRKTGKYHATYKPFFDFLNGKELVLSPQEESYVRNLADTKLEFSSFDMALCNRLLNLIIQDAIISQLFYNVLLKRDNSYKRILPFLKKAENSDKEGLLQLKSQIMEICIRSHSKHPKRYERKAHKRCDTLFEHLLIPEILILRLKSDLKMGFNSLFESIDVIRYVSEDVRKTI